MLTLHDAPGKEIREVLAARSAPSVAEHHGATADRSEPATAVAEPVIAELEPALAFVVGALWPLTIAAGAALGTWRRAGRSVAGGFAALRRHRRRQRSPRAPARRCAL
jgi:hypothetical protein